MRHYSVRYQTGGKWYVKSGILGPVLYRDREKAITVARSYLAYCDDVMVVEERFTQTEDHEGNTVYVRVSTQIDINTTQ